MINSENKENEEAFLNCFKLKPGENRTVNDFYRKQNVKSGNANLGETKNSFCEDFYFKPESRNIKYIDKAIKRSKFINEKDLLCLSSYKFCKFSDIYNYSFKEEILKFELNKEKIQFSDKANLNLYNSLEQLLSINYRLKSNITVYKEMNCFYVKLFLQGKPKWVLIDEHFPVHGNSIRPAFIQPSKESSWIILYEKAYAKINRSYANCIRDLASDIFSVLTEAPLKSLNHSISSNSDIWKQIVVSLKRGLILFTELDSLTIEQFNKEYFLSFFIIGAYTIKSKYYLKLQLPNLRNDNLFKKVQLTLQAPYVSEEISTNSKIISNGEKDVFLVEFDFFIKTFAKTFILFYHDNYIYNYKKTLLRERKYNVVKFNLRSNCHIFLSLILKQSKYYPTMSNYEIPISRLIICKRKSASHLARVNTIRFKEYSAFNEKKKDQSESLEFIDSAVAAAIIQKAVGTQLTCVFVDHGLLRKGEAEQVERDFVASTGVQLVVIDAKEQFLNALKDVTDPEDKRKIIGREFIRSFESAAREIASGGDVEFLVQGTLYPDVVESGGGTGTANIKSHHNVGGLPDDLQFTLVEPLRTLFKDEVRQVGLELGLPEEIVWRQPFPGPGLGIRIVGSVTQERLDLLREADAIARAELKSAGLDRQIWQCPVVLLADVRSVGVQGDGRTYGHPIVLRPVSSEDAMTADWSRVPYEVLEKISTRITNEVRGVNRVVLDVTSKPPATIEWE